MAASTPGVQWRQGPGGQWEYLASDGRWYPPDPVTGPVPPQAGQPAPGAYPASAPSVVATVPCPSCGRAVEADRMACSTCGAIVASAVPLYLATPARRLGQYALDVLLAIVTLFIGWLIWSLIIWGRSQTPGMQILHIRTIRKDTLEDASYGTMALREVVGRWLIVGLIASIFFPAALVLDCMLLWDKDRQQLWDKIAGTTVVNGDPLSVTGSQPVETSTMAGPVMSPAADPGPPVPSPPPSPTPSTAVAPGPSGPGASGSGSPRPGETGPPAGPEAERPGS